jgi:hypothetical protein
MLKTRHISALVNASAWLLLGALLFLVVASYLALPCMARDASQFQTFGAMNSCSERDIFKPQADVSKLFKSIAPETPFRLPVILAAAVVPFLIALLRQPASHASLKRRRREGGRHLPFATADPPKLPQFAALRDA